MGSTNHAILLTQVVTEEDGQYVSHCPELGTVSCGSTLDEAFANLEEAIEVHLSALVEVEELERVFSERGIAVMPIESLMASGTPYRPTPPLGQVVRTVQRHIPSLA